MRFRLKAPFPLLPDALGKLSSPVPFMMPERLAQTDPHAADQGRRRLRPVPLPEGRVGAGQQRRLCQVRRLRAARREAGRRRRRQGGPRRPGGVAHHPRRLHRDRGDADRADGLAGGAVARPAVAGGEAAGPDGVHAGPDRHLRAAAVQQPVPAVRRRRGAPGGAACGATRRLPAGDGRRPRALQRVQGLLPLRHAAVHRHRVGRRWTATWTRRGPC